MNLNEAQKNEIGPFPKNVKPVHIGVYRTWISIDEQPFYQWWDGTNWGVTSNTPERAERHKSKSPIWQNVSWFGLKKE